MLISREIKSTISEVCLKHFQQEVTNPNLELYKGEKFGHFSSSIAYELAKKVGKNPHNLADILIDEIIKNSNLDFEKIENVNGFINFYLSNNFLLSFLEKEIDQNTLGKGNLFENKKVLVEYTDPNPFKLFHIGHFMTNALGESSSRLIKNQGATVVNICYQGDVGIHIAKTILGLLHFIKEGRYTLKDFLNLNNEMAIKELGEAYVWGSKAYSEKEEEKVKIQDLNNLIFKISQKLALENNVELVNEYLNSKNFDYDTIEKIYDKGRKESLKYFEKIYYKLGTKFQDYSFESTTGEIGSKIVKESPLFEESEGAVIWNGKNYENHNIQVLINRFGIPTYGAKEIGLNLLKKQKYNPDLSLIFTAREQEFYFKDLIEIFKQLGLSQQTIHLPHGELRLKTGKMSSRTGEVITLDEVISQIKEHIVINFSSKKDQKFLEGISEKIAISALKYLILKNSIGSNIIYEPEKIVDLNGNTGTYLQYTYARCKSVLKKAGAFDFEANNQQVFNTQEREILIKSSMFNEITLQATKDLSPSTLATYLYDIAKSFNSFYNDNKILDDNTEIKDLRLFLTLITSEILEKGLFLLGMEPLEEL